MTHTAAILKFFQGGNCNDLPSRFYGKTVEDYLVVYRLYEGNANGTLMARYKDGTIQVPRSAMVNGFGSPQWGGSWYEVPESEFLKDFGRAHTAIYGTVDYSASI